MKGENHMIKNKDTKTELPDEPTIIDENDIEDESMHEDDFDGPMNALELENDDFDDWNPELEKIQQLSKQSIISKPTAPTLTPLDKKSIAEVAIPAKFICPLSKQLMTEPVRIAGSKVPIAYEKSAIESHYEEQGTDPMTHEYLDDDAHFLPDLALTREISDFWLKHTQKENTIQA
jgi:hypothetical protein